MSRSAKTPPTTAGFLATVRDLLRAPGRSAPSSARLALAATLAAAAALALAASPAAAAVQPHAFLSAFGEPGSGAGQLSLRAFHFPESGSGLAVNDETGDVYVADTGNHRVDQFSSSGAFIRAFGWGVENGAAEPQTCTTACQAGLPGPEPGQFESPNYIAVDNTPGGGGDLYVSDGTGYNEVQEVTVSASSGTFTLSFEGETTEPIAFNATPETAEQALFSLPSIGEYNIFVRNNYRNRNILPGEPYVFEFQRRLSYTNVPQLTASGGATVETVVDGIATARVQKFGPAGNLLTSWGGTPAPGLIDGAGSCPSCGAGYFPHFGDFGGLAVNAAGALLVLDSPNNGEGEGLRGQQGRFTEWSQSSGEFVGGPGPYSEGRPTGIALDPAGHLYTGEGPSKPPYRILRTSPCWTENIYAECKEEPVQSRPPDAYQPDFILDPGPAVGVAVDPATEAVYVARYNPTGHHSEVSAHDPEGNELEPPFGSNGEITEAGAIAASAFAGSQGDVYVADPGAGRVEIFAPGGPRASLTITRAGTSLGSVSSAPAGIACPSTCSTSFPEGEEVTLTATAPEHSSFLGFSGGGCSGTGPCQITLAAATSVTATFAQDRPALTTEPAAAIARYSATLSGAVDPEGDASSCAFQYGPSAAYGAEAPCSAHPGSGAGPVPVSAELWDLAASTTYHYRLVSANTGGTAYGPDETFTTASESCASNAALCPALPTGPPLANVALVLPKQTTTKKALTNAQKLAKTLKACKKQKKKSARVSCEKQARKKYAPAKKKAKKSTRNRKRG